jgi:hypothetical protein
MIDSIQGTPFKQVRDPAPTVINLTPCVRAPANLKEVERVITIYAYAVVCHDCRESWWHESRSAEMSERTLLSAVAGRACKHVLTRLNRE